MNYDTKKKDSRKPDFSLWYSKGLLTQRIEYITVNYFRVYCHKNEANEMYHWYIYYTRLTDQPVILTPRRESDGVRGHCVWHCIYPT